MNTLLSWVPLALYFMGSLAATSLVGFVCYKAVRWMDAKVPDVLVVVEFISAWLAFLGLVTWLLSDLSNLGGVGIVAAICGAGSFAERAVSPAPKGWAEVFLRMLFTTACSVALSLIPVVAAYSGPASAGPASVTWLALGSAMGAFCSPSVVPIFVWMWRSMEIRPGIDRPLEPEERLNAER